MGKYNKLYNELGVSEAADATTIKKAYRKKVKKVHPDHGGSEEDFNKVNKAYLILSDTSKRSKYDATGDETLSEPDNEKQKAMMIISTAMERSITQFEQRGRDACECDLLADMRQKIKEEIQKGEKHIDTCNILMKKTKKLQGRFKMKKGNNFLEQMINAKMDNITLTIRNSEREIEPLKMAYDLLTDAEFRFDQPNKQEYNAPIGFGWNGL